MAKCENQKLKILYLKQYLEERTDAQHPASMAELISYLASKGISAERKSIAADINALDEFGMEIMRSRGKNAGYYFEDRTFQTSEVELLVDLAQSSKFLSESKSRDLIKKLGTLVSTHHAKILNRSVTVSGRVKSMNESIYYNVDNIHRAINHNSRITFKYYEWGLDCNKHEKGRLYTASPYALCFDSENYYLIAHTVEHQITHFRVDKMGSISETGEPRIVTAETKNLNMADYAKQVFFMFGGENITVRLRFHNSLVGVVIDRFGRDIMLIPDGKEHFCFTTAVAMSRMFLGWLASFGSKVEILSPDSAIDAFRALCRESLEQYK